ncbi:MAG: non-homologous end-joining DNA ligase [Verrucomicrobiota bacterium]
MKSKDAEITVGKHKVLLTNLQKVFYPKTGFTKGEVIDYYIQISEYILPHLKDRPITLKRYPDGVDGFYFYEKQCPAHHPNWLKTTSVKKSNGDSIHYCLMNDLPSLVWASNLADLELHTFLHRRPYLNRPTVLAFDLDPGPPATILDCAHVALRLNTFFEGCGLQSFPKTSGSKGIQVYVPLNTPTTYEKTKAFAHEVALELEEEFPELIVSKMQKNLRTGKVLVDWSQNDAHKTTVSVYSLRAKDSPTVSTPVTWNEVQQALKKKNKNLLSFDSQDVLKRVKERGDLFEPVLRLKQKLPRIEVSVPA